MTGVEVLRLQNKSELYFLFGYKIATNQKATAKTAQVALKSRRYLWHRNLTFKEIVINNYRSLSDTYYNMEVSVCIFLINQLFYSFI